MFFGVDTAGSPEPWDAVQRELSLAVRFNENLIAGDIQGRRAIDIRLDGRSVPVEFVLYVVPPTAI